MSHLPIDTDAIRAKLTRMVGSKIAPPFQWTDSWDLLDLDSLAMAEVLAEIEKEFGIRIGADILDIDNAEELVQYIARQLARRTA